MEDFALQRPIVTVLLELTGHPAVSVGTGRAAIEALQMSRYDIVFLDARMAGMDGFETTRLIRAEEARRGGHVPIIALLSRDMKGEEEQCLGAGMDGFLFKPVRLAPLQRAIEQWTGPDAARPTPARPALKAMDSASLLRRVEGDVNLMKEVIDLYIIQLPSLRAALDEALRREDAQEVARAAHAMRGVFLNLSAGPAATAAGQLEDHGREGRLTELGPAADSLLRELSRVQGSLEELRATL
ncbi:response regulator [Hyalangium versicolor]|uniref:response regulator n=1 Tax=Hyalangium versicolor TaxID=2861190 RepID=UPI002815C28E|nr:response regulator [Hyalangium versicolor]